MRQFVETGKVILMLQLRDIGDVAGGSTGFLEKETLWHMHFVTKWCLNHNHSGRISASFLPQEILVCDCG